jgi:hypothetical protein
MSTIVAVAWDSLAVATEVGVMANGTFVADTGNVLTLILTKRSVAVDANVASLSHMWFRDGIIDSGKAMSWMNMPSALDTVGTKVPIRAVETLVAYTVDCLVTSVANRSMADITAWGAEKLCSGSHQGFGGRGLERVTWMVSVGIIFVAGHAQIVIFAVLTSDEVILWELCGKVSGNLNHQR